MSILLIPNLSEEDLNKTLRNLTQATTLLKSLERGPHPTPPHPTPSHSHWSSVKLGPTAWVSLASFSSVSFHFLLQVSCSRWEKIRYECYFWAVTFGGNDSGGFSLLPEPGK